MEPHSSPAASGEVICSSRASPARGAGPPLGPSGPQGGPMGGPMHPSQGHLSQGPNSNLQYHEMQPAQHGSGQAMARQGMSSSTSPLSVHTSYNPSNQFKINVWQNRNFDSGIHSLQHSQAASFMSLHAGSQMSGMSVMDNAELTDQQQQKFENLSVSFHPNQSEHGSAVRAIPELLNLIRDDDEMVVFKALGIMQNIAKMDSDHSTKAVIRSTDVVQSLANVLREKADHPNIIRVALGGLFHICGREQGLDLVFQVISGTGGELLGLLVPQVSNMQCSAHRYALLTLHTILSDKKRSAQWLGVAKQHGAIEAIGRCLVDERSEKSMSIIVDLVRILCDGDREIDQFLAAQGASKLVMVLKNFNYENLLFRTTKLLKTFSNKRPQEMVACGVPLAMAHQLSHGSQRLVVTSLECLRILSDMGNNDQQIEVLRSLIQLFGNGNLQVVLYTVQIIANLMANNRANKEFLVSQHCVPYLVRVLSEYSGGQHLSDEESKKLEELQETILTILKSLCSGHSLSGEVQQRLFERPDLFLEKLISMRPHLLKQTLLLLSKLATHNQNLAAFRDLRMQKNDGMGMVSYVEQLVYILRVTCNVMGTMELVENVKVSDLACSSMSLLHCLCRDNTLLEQIATCLLHSDNMKVNNVPALLPVFILQQNWGSEDSLVKTSILLLKSLVASPQVAELFYSSPQLMSCLQQLEHGSNREFAQLAHQAIQTIMLGGAPPENAYPAYPNRASTSMAPHPSARPSVCPSPSIPEEPMDGSGDQWPEDLANLALDEPLAQVFCPTNPPHNTPPFSPNVAKAPQNTAHPATMHHSAQGHSHMMSPQDGAWSANQHQPMADVGPAHNPPYGMSYHPSWNGHHQGYGSDPYAQVQYPADPNSHGGYYPTHQAIHGHQPIDPHQMQGPPGSVPNNPYEYNRYDQYANQRYPPH